METATTDTWIDEMGCERGVCLCGTETSTHPDDFAGGFARCPNCDVITCAACRNTETAYCRNCDRPVAVESETIERDANGCVLNHLNDYGMCIESGCPAYTALPPCGFVGQQFPSVG